MATFSAAVRTTMATVNSASIEIIASSSVPATLLEIGLTAPGAAAAAVGFGVPAAKGITPGSMSTVQNEDQNGPNGNTQIALTWGTGPTTPMIMQRRVEINSLGTGAIWTFPQGVIVPVNKTAVVWNFAASNYDIWVVLEE